MGVVPIEGLQMAVQAAAAVAAALLVVLVVLRAAVAANNRRCPIDSASCATVARSSYLYLWCTRHLATLLYL